MSVIGTPTAGLSATEIDCVEEMVQWALSERYRGLRFVAPNDGSCLQNDLLGVPVTRTAIVDGIELMGRLLFGRECSLCTLHRTPDGPVIVGRPVSAMTVEPSLSRLPYDFSQIRSPFPFGVDLRRIRAPRFSLALAGGGALVVSGVFAGIAPVVATAATSVVQPASMPGLMPDPGLIAPVPVQVDPDVGGKGGNDGFHPRADDPSKPDLNRPYDPTDGDLKNDHTGAGRGAAAGVPAPASLDGVIPPAGQGLDAAGGSDGSGNPYAPAQVDPAEVVGGGHKLESRTETREVPAEVVESVDEEPQEEPGERGPEPAVVDDAPEPDVVDVTPPGAFPSNPEPVQLPEPVEPPVTEVPPPAPTAPLPVEAAEVAPVESEVTPERPAGVQDPADLRGAAGHYRTAADLLDEAADEIEAGDAALAGESEAPTGQGGGVGDTAEAGTSVAGDEGDTAGNDVDLDGVGDGTGTEVSADADAEVSNADLKGADVSITIGGLELKVNGQTEEIDLSINGKVVVDASGTATVVPDDGGVSAEVTTTAA